MGTPIQLCVVIDLPLKKRTIARVYPFIVPFTQPLGHKLILKPEGSPNNPAYEYSVVATERTQAVMNANLS